MDTIMRRIHNLRLDLKEKQTADKRAYLQVVFYGFDW